MNNIRDSFSRVMGVRIQNDNWLGYIQMLEREAHFNNYHRNQLLVILGQGVDELQAFITGQQATIEMLRDQIKELQAFQASFAPRQEPAEEKKTDAPPTKPHSKDTVQPAKK